MGVNYNPNLPKNDALEPWEIEAKVAARNAETRSLTEKAYIVSGVPPSTAERAADHSSIARQTPEAKKARKDAKVWWKAKNIFGGDDGDE